MSNDFGSSEKDSMSQESVNSCSVRPHFFSLSNGLEWRLPAFLTLKALESFIVLYNYPNYNLLIVNKILL
jgi:hypothetical protein